MTCINPDRPNRRGWKAPLTSAIVAGLLGTTAMTASAAASSSDTSDAKAAASSDRGARQDGSLVTTSAPVVAGGFVGEFTPTSFENKGGTLYAVGELAGTLNGRDAHKQVRLPVKGASSAEQSEAGGFAALATCSILSLDLGPLDLNLLGLRVQLNEIHLDITAIEGPGNLLGNLLCSVAGLLDGGLLGGGSPLSGLLDSITGLLNAILAL